MTTLGTPGKYQQSTKAATPKTMEEFLPKLKGKTLMIPCITSNEGIKIMRDMYPEIYTVTLREKRKQSLINYLRTINKSIAPAISPNSFEHSIYNQLEPEHKVLKEIPSDAKYINIEDYVHNIYNRTYQYNDKLNYSLN